MTLALPGLAGEQVAAVGPLMFQPAAGRGPETFGGPAVALDFGHWANLTYNDGFLFSVFGYLRVSLGFLDWPLTPVFGFRFSVKK
jgi:hypothetical protein